MNTSLMAAGIEVSNPRLLIREYDLAPSSRIAVLQFPNGTLTSGVGSTMSVTFVGSSLGGGSTNYIQNTDSLQSGSTFYVSSGTVNSTFTATVGRFNQVFVSTGGLEIRGSTDPIRLFNSTVQANVGDFVEVFTSTIFSKSPLSIVAESSITINRERVFVSTHLTTPGFLLASNIVTAYTAVATNPDDVAIIDWTNSATMVNVPQGDVLIDCSWHSPYDRCEMRFVFRMDNDANDSVARIYDTTGGAQVVDYNVAGGQVGYNDFATGWVPYNWRGMRRFNIQYRTTNTASYTGIQKAWILVKPVNP